MEDFVSYKEVRKGFSAKWGGRALFEYVDQWPLYVGTRNFARFLYISDLLRETLIVPGDVAEFGSWRGANVVLLAKLLDILVPHSPKRVHCFEGFEGLSTFVPEDGEQEAQRGRYRGNYEELKDLIDLYQLGSRIAIHKGLIQDTVPRFAVEDSARQFSFLYFDADLYEPARLMLDHFHERLSVGGLIVFDEWNTPQWPGETRAVSEFLHGRSDFEVLSPPYTPQPSLVLRKTAA